MRRKLSALFFVVATIVSISLPGCDNPAPLESDTYLKKEFHGSTNTPSTYNATVSNSRIKFEITLPSQKQFVRLFARKWLSTEKRWLQTVAESIVDNYTLNSDGTVTYSVTEYGFYSEDSIQYRFYSADLQGSTFTPGPSEDDWAYVSFLANVPEPWGIDDVGSPSIKGSAGITEWGQFYISGAGYGFGGQSDQFTFLNQEIKSDTALFLTISNSIFPSIISPASCGVMFRESLSANSKFVAVILTPNSFGLVNIRFAWRDSTGGNVSFTDFNSGYDLITYGLERIGDTFYLMTNYRYGTRWMASHTLSMNQIYKAGIFYCSNDSQNVSTAKNLYTRFTKSYVNWGFAKRG